MNDQTGDEQLIADARAGDMSAFKTLVQRYEGKVAGVVKSMLGDTPEAVDTGQEVFIRLYETLDKFRGESSLGTYLIRIAINLSLNELKRRKRKWNLLRPLEAGHEATSEESNIETKEAVRYEINKLDPDFRLVVTLRMIEGYSTEETAKILDIPIGTVLSRLSRAQKKLKEVLSKYLTT
ncbi:MAG TPA: sigma-70 family RNA polymerase sigma factor [Cyclobacteriaceae bacterium]|nr:sigma-70 family RNA polymerase sigma factor [Cyclobacteriaceae bacterium]